MPRRSYRKTIDEGLKTLADEFAEERVKEEKTLAQQKGRKTKDGLAFSIRNKRIGIKEGAQTKKQLIITYKKTTTGEVNKYTVAPYSWRYRQLKVGLRKMLYAWDMKDKRIKSFALRNIRNVVVTKKKYSPKWTVEIK